MIPLLLCLQALVVAAVGTVSCDFESETCTNSSNNLEQTISWFLRPSHVTAASPLLVSIEATLPLATEESSITTSICLCLAEDGCSATSLTSLAYLHTTTQNETTRFLQRDSNRTQISASAILSFPQGGSTLIGMVQFTDPSNPTHPTTLVLPAFGIVAVERDEVKTVNLAMFCLVGLMQLVAICILAWLLSRLFVHRHHPTITHAQGRVLAAMVVLSLIAVLATFSLATTSNLSCLLLYWAILLPTMAVFALMCARVWRFDRLCEAAAQCQRLTVPQSTVFKLAFALLVPFLLLTTVRQLHSPPRAITTTDHPQPFCHSDHNALFDALNFVCVLSMVLLGVYSAWRSSRLVDRFNEGPTMAFSLYLGSILMCVTLPGLSLSTSNPTTMYFLGSTLIVLVNTVICGSLLFPKLKMIKAVQVDDHGGGTITITHAMASAVLTLADLLPSLTNHRKARTFSPYGVTSTSNQNYDMRLSETQIEEFQSAIKSLTSVLKTAQAAFAASSVVLRRRKASHPNVTTTATPPLQRGPSRANPESRDNSFGYKRARRSLTEKTIAEHSVTDLLSFKRKSKPEPRMLEARATWDVSARNFA